MSKVLVLLGKGEVSKVLVLRGQCEVSASLQKDQATCKGRSLLGEIRQVDK